MPYLTRAARYRSASQETGAAASTDRTMAVSGLTSSESEYLLTSSESALSFCLSTERTMAPE